jgi:peptidoglycan lytic transglycosylase
MYNLIVMALTQAYTMLYAQMAATYRDVRASFSTTCSQLERNSMKSAPPLFGPSLTGWVLVASLVFGCQGVSRTLAGAGADGLLRIAMRPSLPPSRVQIGMASWYGRRWQGRPTASGARYDRSQLTAAHRTAPLGTQAIVTNLANGYTVRVRITDRGPHTRRRILDLSYEAARRLAMVRTGAARVKIEFLTASSPLA